MTQKFTFILNDFRLCVFVYRERHCMRVLNIKKVQFNLIYYNENIFFCPALLNYQVRDKFFNFYAPTKIKLTIPNGEMTKEIKKTLKFNKAQKKTFHSHASHC